MHRAPRAIGRDARELLEGAERDARIRAGIIHRVATELLELRRPELRMLLGLLERGAEQAPCPLDVFLRLPSLAIRSARSERETGAQKDGREGDRRGMSLQCLDGVCGVAADAFADRFGALMQYLARCEPMLEGRQRLIHLFARSLKVALDLARLGVGVFDGVHYEPPPGR